MSFRYDPADDGAGIHKLQTKWYSASGLITASGNSRASFFDRMDGYARYYNSEQRLGTGNTSSNE